MNTAICPDCQAVHPEGMEQWDHSQRLRRYTVDGAPLLPGLRGAFGRHGHHSVAHLALWRSHIGKGRNREEIE